ncbi:hypothetical protein [Pedobacter sp. WC2423]|uniref:hypothetical protein n=1 Tax=Pedobacter sp. WC2423 TaxID=3234142 RepID=UPI00346579D8
MENTRQPTPRELITTSITETLLEPLTQSGFTFSKSSLIFKKNSSDFTQTISFQLNRHNETGISAEFWTIWNITSKAYSKWYKANYGTRPLNDHVFTEPDWNIENWEFPVINNKQESHFQIIEETQRPEVLTILKNNILNIGIPALNYFSNWENAANNLLSKNSDHHKASDFFQLAGNPEKSLLALQQGLNYWKQHPNASNPEHLEEIHKRLS